MRTAPLCATALVLLLSVTAGAQAPAPEGGAPEAGKPNAAKKSEKGDGGAQPFGMLKVEPDPSLNGAEFTDEEWGISIRLPKGFQALEASQLEALRRATIPPEADRRLKSGNIQKKQVFVFDDGLGARILIDCYDPPLQISTPVGLRQLILSKARESGQRMEEAGKPLQFQARGNRRGSLTEFDTTLPDGRLLHQLVASIRAGNRSFLVYGTTDQAKFLEYEKMFQQAITTIALRSDASEVAENAPLVESRRWEGKRNALVITFNLIVLALVVFACMRLRRSTPELSSSAA